LPVDVYGQFIGTELATLSDGLTYVSMPAVAVLPPQPKEISLSVKEITLSPALASELKTASPHVALINERVHDRIRTQYTLDDELKLARISIGALQNIYTPSTSDLQAASEYQIAVESARIWGRAEKAKLGL